MRRIPWLMLVLAACGPDPTMAGGDTTPAAGHIFFSRSHTTPGLAEGPALHMTVDDQFAAVPVAPREAIPVASPDGRYIAWLTTVYPVDFTSPPVTSLHTYDRHTGHRRRVLSDDDRPGSLSWSRRPMRLSFTRTDTHGGGQPALLSSSPDGSDVRVELAPDQLAGASPAISPDGRTAVVMSQPLPYRLETIDLASGARAFLTPAPDTAERIYLRAPAWSPDGRYIVLIAQDFRTDQVALRVIDRQGVPRWGVDVTDNASTPTWSPDGQQVAFCRTVPDPSQGQFYYREEVVVWTLRTGAVQVITPEGAADCYPSWTR